MLDARGNVDRNVRWSLADVLHFNIDVQSDDATLHVRVPSGLKPSLRIATKSGDVTLPEMSLAKAELQTLSGDVEIGRLTAQALRVATMSGDLAARDGIDAAGIRVETASGQISIARAKGALDVRTLSGDVDLGAAGSVIVATTSGDVRVDLDSVSGEVEGRSVSGDIRMRVRRDASVSVEMSTRSGEIRSDFGGGSGDGRLSYEPAGAQHRVSLDSTSGDLSLMAL
jgi:lia operon protein LiaG